MSTLTSLKKLYKRLTGKNSKASTNSEAIGEIDTTLSSSVDSRCILPAEYLINRYGVEIPLDKYTPGATTVVAHIDTDEARQFKNWPIMEFHMIVPDEEPGSKNEDYMYIGHDLYSNLVFEIYRCQPYGRPGPDYWYAMIYTPSVEAQEVKLSTNSWTKKPALNYQWLSIKKMFDKGCPIHMTCTVSPYEKLQFEYLGVNSDDRGIFKAEMPNSDNSEMTVVLFIQPSGNNKDSTMTGDFVTRTIFLESTPT